MVLTPEEREEAYIHLMVERAAGAGTQKRVGATIDSAKFKKLVMERYGAMRTDTPEPVQYCVVTGEWFQQFQRRRKEPQWPVIAAHLVPRVLGGDDLGYLFGVKDGAAILSDPYNGKHLSICLA
jgi:hypothetical protein